MKLILLYINVSIFLFSEYYFSDENLAKDVYLRRNMDQDGFVPIEVIANFRRIQNMTTDLDLILSAVQMSNKLIVKEDKKRVRPVENPTKWLISESAVTTPLASPPPSQTASNNAASKTSEDAITHSLTKKVSGNSEMLNLNPDVPEFVPKSVNGYSSTAMHGGSGRRSSPTLRHGEL